MKISQLTALGERIACNLNDQMKQPTHITPAEGKKDRLDTSLLEREEKWKRYARNKGMAEVEDTWTKAEWFWFAVIMFILTVALAWMATDLAIQVGIL